MSNINHLKKELGFIEVFSIASGAMISSGLFVLPAIAYQKTGPSLIISYCIAALLMIPAMLSKAELSTAMPKSGGTYFFIHRSLGALFGTFAGFSSWFSLALKSAFALIGIGVFISPFFEGASPDLVKLIAIGCTVFFTLLNIFSVKESGRFQVILVLGLLGSLLFYIFKGINTVDINSYVPFRPNGWFPVFTVTGLIFVSFGGLTKVASVAEEVKNPGKTIPNAMFAAFIIVTMLYIAAIFVTTGVLSKVEFMNTLTPISLGASKFSGDFGYYLLSLAAMMAFITTGNAGLLASSRTPLAMSKDNLLPSLFSRMSIKYKTPVVSILLTGTFMALVIAFLDIESLVKVASTMMLILFTFVNMSVILMRESKIVSYKPAYKSPFYPYLHIAGIIVYITLIIEMGALPLTITALFFILSLFWYILYSRRRNDKDSALIRIVERVTTKEIRSSSLTTELKEILIERDEIVEDKFDHLIQDAVIIDIKEKIDADKLFRMLAETGSKKINMSADAIYDKLKKREEESTTVIQSGLAIPHIILEGSNYFDIIVVRSKEGIDFGKGHDPVNIVFALGGTMDERNFHLKALMAIAQIVQNNDFLNNWLKARSVEELRNLILLAQRVRKGEI